MAPIVWFILSLRYMSVETATSKPAFKARTLHNELQKHMQTAEVQALGAGSPGFAGLHLRARGGDAVEQDV